MGSKQNITMTWNGREWVKSATVKSNGYSSYTYAQPSSSVFTNPTNPSAPAPVSSEPGSVTKKQREQAISQYTEYFKHWSSQGKNQRAKAETLKPGPEKDELIRVAAWAD